MLLSTMPDVTLPCWKREKPLMGSSGNLFLALRYKTVGNRSLKFQRQRRYPTLSVRSLNSAVLNLLVAPSAMRICRQSGWLMIIRQTVSDTWNYQLEQTTDRSSNSTKIDFLNRGKPNHISSQYADNNKRASNENKV